MSSTLIIGIGTSGLEIIEQCQQFIFEFTGSNRPGSNVEYIYIETNENRNPKKTALGTTDIVSVKVPLDGALATLEQMRTNKDIDSTWAPNPSQILMAGVGAGGAPSYGRLSIWDSNHYSLLKQTIKNAYHRLNAGNIRVLITGTLTGGTGSGLCVDIAYIANSIIGNGSSKNTNGLFLIPDTGSFGIDKALFENTFSALSAINKYEKAAFYQTRIVDGSDIIGNGPPFEFVQYLSPQFNDSRPPLPKGDLVRSAGIMVGLQIMDTEKPEIGNKKHFASLLLERRVDSKTNDRIKNSLTAGFTIIQYPKFQLQELLAIKLSSEILSSLIDNQNFVDKNGNTKSIQSESVNINKQTKEALEDILKRGFEHLDGVKGSNGSIIAQSLEAEAQIIVSKSHSAPTNVAYYYNLFKTGFAGNFFDLLSANKSTLRDWWIDELHGFILETTNNYKNLRITQLVLNQITEYIPKIIKFYNDSYKIIGQDNTWDKLLQGNINEYKNEKGVYKLLLSELEFTTSKLKQTCDLLKIHIGIAILEQLREEITNGVLNLRTLNSKELPTTNKVNTIINEIETLVSGSGDSNKYTLKQRESEIRQILSSKNSCFRMLYTSGNLDGDMDFAYNTYKKSLDNKLNASKLFENTDIWPFLNSVDLDLYTTSIKNSVQFVRANKFTGEGDLINIIQNIDSNSPERDVKNLFSKEQAEIKTNIVPPLVPLDNTKFRFAEDPSSKLIFISKSYSEINDKLLKNTHFKLDPGVAGSNAVDIVDLDNTIIIYQEYGYMGEKNGVKVNFDPLENISYIGITKEHLNNVSDDKFKMKKVPYMSLEEFKSYLV